MLSVLPSTVRQLTLLPKSLMTVYVSAPSRPSDHTRVNRLAERASIERRATCGRGCLPSALCSLIQALSSTSLS